MSFTPSPLQTLVLFKLLFTGQEPKISDEKQLKPRDRKQLEQAGFIELEKRGRATHILLTDKAWAWAGHNLEARIPTQARTVDTFRALMARLQAYLEATEIPLAEFLAPQAEEQDQKTSCPDNVQQAILEACHYLAQGQTDVRIRLKDLRRHLERFDRAQVDQTLLQMQNQGRLVLMHLNDPQDRTRADDEAAISILGYTRHLVYWNE